MLNGKVALVTGATQGLGRAVLEEICEQGGKVFFTYNERHDLADAIVAEKRGKCACLQANASDYQQARLVAEKAYEHFGRIDLLVNNAAAAKHKPIDKLSFEDWDFSIRHVLYPVFHYTQAVLPFFMRQSSGKIVNIGSINGIRGREGSAPYCAAKAGIIGFTKTVAKEMGVFKITCNVVAPGFIDTDGQAHTSPLIRKMVLDECAIRELAQPEEIAKLVTFLLSKNADAITGQVYQIDYGQYI